MYKLFLLILVIIFMFVSMAFLFGFVLQFNYIFKFFKLLIINFYIFRLFSYADIKNKFKNIKKYYYFNIFLNKNHFRNQLLLYRRPSLILK
jgi:hypothetical protein